jgi:hypothetical protein
MTFEMVSFARVISLPALYGQQGGCCLAVRLIAVIPFTTSVGTFYDLFKNEI